MNRIPKGDRPQARLFSTQANFSHEEGQPLAEIWAAVLQRLSHRPSTRMLFIQQASLNWLAHGTAELEVVPDWLPCARSNRHLLHEAFEAVMGHPIAVILRAGAEPVPVTPAGLLPQHWAELQASGIAADVAAQNVASFGPGTTRHWENERAELVAHARLKIQTASVAGNGHAQNQAGHLAPALIKLDQRYRHLEAGGWRSLSEALPGLKPFDQWKPDQARPKFRKNGAGQWMPQPGKAIKYEAQPQHPAGGGLLLPVVPLRCWELICKRQGLPLPDGATIAAGFWPWALTTPGLQLLICEGWKKALAAVGAGWAAVALPGVQMGRRVGLDGTERLIAELQLLAAGRRWLIAFDAEARPSTASKVAAAAGALARALRSADGLVEVARLPLLPGTDKTGLDDLLAVAGPEALARALADTAPRPVLPRLRAADLVAPAGAWLGEVCPYPGPDIAQLLVVQAPIGCGKTEAAAARVAPLAAAGVAMLMPSHRKALGQAAAERLGVPWCPEHGSPERWQGVAGCWDSWCSDSYLRINGSGWSGGVVLLDEWMQAVEHLLLSTGTALAKRRGPVLRTAAEQLSRASQIIAMDAQLSDWGVQLLERLSGQRAYLIRSDHKPMAGRPLCAPAGFKTPKAAANAFRAKWAELVAAGDPFLCWCSAQRADVANSPQRLADLHHQRRPNARVVVIDSTTPELAAELAADPDGFAQRFDALYVSPAISSGISFRSWKPAAVIAYAGGRIAPEHVAQALGRVRCPAVPAFVFAPERCPGNALRVGSGATKGAQLIADLRAVADPLLGVLADAGDAWLDAWGELGATRNRQRFAYRATIAGLLEREGWALQSIGPEPCQIEGSLVGVELKAAAVAAREAIDQAVIVAPLLQATEATELQRRRHLDADKQAGLDRYRLAQRWGLGAAAPTIDLLGADRDGLRDRLRLGWLLTTPEALELIPKHDQAVIAALDPNGLPFAPDRVRVALSHRVAALQALRLPQLLERFAAGKSIAANDPELVTLHLNATIHRNQLAAAVGVSPGRKGSGTLRALLQACGWDLKAAGRIKARGTDRDAYTYTAAPMGLPLGVNAQALAAVWLAELNAPIAGAKTSPIDKTYREEKSPTASPRETWFRVQDRSVALPWAAGPLLTGKSVDSVYQPPATCGRQSPPTATTVCV
jgi:Domain of unknown function (DUF3854)